MNKKDTWERLIKLGKVADEMPQGKWLLSKASLLAIDLRKADLRKADLSGAILIGANLSEANFTGTDLSRAILIRADLSRANLTGTDLTGANLTGTNLTWGTLRKSILTGAILNQAIFKEAIIVGANFTETMFVGAELFRANLRWTNLHKANLTGTNFKEADLRGADLTESIISDVNFNLADLSGADITGSTFWGVSNTGWKIEGIKAQYIYFCPPDDTEKEKHRRNFTEGQFEELFKSLPTIELIFDKGLSFSELLALTALIERVEKQNSDFRIEIANISKNKFETKVGVNVGKDEHLQKVGQILQESISKAVKGIPAETLVPQLKQMLPQEVRPALENLLNRQPPEIVIDINIAQPTINLITTTGSIESINRYGAIQSGGHIILNNYRQHGDEIDRLFLELKGAFSEYDASMRGILIDATDRMVGAIREGKEVDKIQRYWEEIKEGIKVAGPLTAMATTIGPHIARLLGLIP